MVRASERGAGRLQSARTVHCSRPLGTGSVRKRGSAPHCCYVVLEQPVSGPATVASRRSACAGTSRLCARMDELDLFASGCASPRDDLNDASGTQALLPERFSAADGSCCPRWAPNCGPVRREAKLSSPRADAVILASGQTASTKATQYSHWMMHACAILHSSSTLPVPLECPRCPSTAGDSQKPQPHSGTWQIFVEERGTAILMFTCQIGVCYTLRTDRLAAVVLAPRTSAGPAAVFLESHMIGDLACRCCDWPAMGAHRRLCRS